MSISFTRVKAKGQIVIPVSLRRRFQIREGMRLALVEDDGRLVIQPVSDQFIEGMKGILQQRGMPAKVEKDPDRDLR